MRNNNSMSRGMIWPKTGTIIYHTQLRLSEKGRVIKGLVICTIWDVRALIPAKRSDPTLLSTVSWDILIV